MKISSITRLIIKGKVVPVLN